MLHLIMALPHIALAVLSGITAYRLYSMFATDYTAKGRNGAMRCARNSSMMCFAHLWAALPEMAVYDAIVVLLALWYWWRWMIIVESVRQYRRTTP